MIYEKLTPMEYLDFVAGLWAVDTVSPRRARATCCHWLGLAPHADERCERLSKGMRQKVALAGALVHEPKLIMLDEPFTGLDAGSSRVVKEVLRERVHAGCSVIMTTHILEVAERMADRIGVMANGRLIADGRWMIAPPVRLRPRQSRGHIPRPRRARRGRGMTRPARSAGSRCMKPGWHGAIGCRS